MLHISLEGPSCCHYAPHQAQAACWKRTPVRGNAGAVLIKAAPLMFCSSLEGKLKWVHLSRGKSLRVTACEKLYRHANAR